MQWILPMLNPLNLNTSSIDFAAYIANLTRSYVVGMFLKDEKEHSAVPKSIYQFKDEEETAANYSSINNGLARENLQLFENTDFA